MNKNIDFDKLKDYVFNEYYFSNPDKLNALITYINKDITNTKKIDDSDVFVSELIKVLNAAKSLQTVDSYNIEQVNTVKK